MYSKYSMSSTTDKILQFSAVAIKRWASQYGWIEKVPVGFPMICQLMAAPFKIYLHGPAL